MEKAVNDLQHDMASIRTGRASISILDHIRVDYYGTPTPLNQIGNLHVPEPSLITVQPWDVWDAAINFGLNRGAPKYQVLFGRAAAWLGRGVRTPARKALLAADVPPAAYGRAFGFERLMDTLGAIAGPLTALWLLNLTSHSYRQVFLWTLLPGMIAVASMWFLVRERPFAARPQQSFLGALRALPASFRRFLAGVGVFGAGDFSHTLLILYAARQLGPAYGSARAASLAVALYTLHNVFYASSAYASGWLSDRVRQRKFVLAAGYGFAGVTALLLCLDTTKLWLLGTIFALAGLYIGTEEALEDSLAAELVPKEQHGMAFGTLAAVNAVGDFLSSLLVGFLWSSFSLQAAFGYSAVLFFAGALLILRLRPRE